MTELTINNVSSGGVFDFELMYFEYPEIPSILVFYLSKIEIQC